MSFVERVETQVLVDIPGHRWLMVKTYILKSIYSTYDIVPGSSSSRAIRTRSAKSAVSGLVSSDEVFSRASKEVMKI